MLFALPYCWNFKTTRMFLFLKNSDSEGVIVPQEIPKCGLGLCCLFLFSNKNREEWWWLVALKNLGKRTKMNYVILWEIQRLLAGANPRLKVPLGNEASTTLCPHGMGLQIYIPPGNQSITQHLYLTINDILVSDVKVDLFNKIVFIGCLN